MPDTTRGDGRKWAVGDKHPDAERCFYCASDAELAAARSGHPHVTIRMDSLLSQCPREPELGLS